MTQSAIKRYWNDMTPQQRSEEMRRRMAKGLGGKQPATRLAPEQIINMIVERPDEFYASIDSALQELAIEIQGHEGDIQRCRRRIERLKNLRGSIEVEALKDVHD